MYDFDTICIWIAEITPLVGAFAAFIYGIKHFFKKGKPLYLQSITMAMGCHSLGSVYHICQMLTRGAVSDGFTPAYLGRIGFFLFFLVASYGQMDRIVDDRSPALRKSRIWALLAPALGLLLYIPNFLKDMPNATKVTYFLVWIPAIFSLYFNLKHVIIPNIDFGFVKAIKPYNIFALCLGFSELVCLTTWNYPNSIALVITAFIFAGLCVSTVVSAKKGVEKWTI